MKMLYPDNHKGFTVVELMISVTIGLILISAATATYIAQNRSYVAQESVAEINTQAKLAQDLIARDSRSAGFGVPLDMNAEPINGNTTIITPIDSAATSDAITIVSGFQMIGTIWPVGGAPGMPCPAAVPLGSTQFVINYSGTEGPNVTDKQYINIDGVEFVRVQNCNIPGGTTSCDTGTITIDRPLSQNFPLQDNNGDGLCDGGRPIYLIEDVTYCVDANSLLHRISRNGNPANCTALATSTDDIIAENIEDLQFAFAADQDGDGQTDNLGGTPAIDAADFQNGIAIADPSDITTVRINVLARSDKPDPNFAGLGNPPASVENRNHAPVNDNFKRRLWQIVVAIRNQ
ncbi:MAG: PilW family protein [Nitrospiraceae bacterium]|nr:MAG: PilW family protein [Nitrospiraceae bacterium]